VAERTFAPLPRGRHSLTREQVADAQRLRLAVAMAEEMADHGYVGTPVAAVLRRAGVSRQTFYELYDDKLGCFLDALDLVGAVLLGELGAAAGSDDAAPPLDRAARVVDRYLRALVDHPAFARLFIVEVHAAGPEAVRRRAALQDRVVDALAALVGAPTPRARFACRAYVAGVASIVTEPLVAGDHEAILALRDPLVEHLRALADAGVLGG